LYIALVLNAELKPRVPWF